jgi:dimethylhistidine N-methyltransferase
VTPAGSRSPELAAEVRAGLTDPGQKRLPSRLFYDDIGSALFDVISLLPEYGLTRADERILRRHAAAIVAALPAVHTVAELGSGSGRKTRWILEALGPGAAHAYYPIDISRGALARCVHELADVPDVLLSPIEADYLGGLATAVARRPGTTPLLVLFLGSTIGNFERADGERFLAAVRAVLAPGDALLLGTDLVKPEPQLLAAYDDALGVTAAFNLNLLAHVNRELGADFDLTGFAHQIRWDPEARRIEMHLRARREQTVHFAARGLDVAFRAGETIWTESSHKYTADEPAAIAARTGFACAGQWRDEDWAFAETLLIAR